MARFIDLTGNTFGRLTAIARNPVKNGSGSIRWDCQCVCGNKVIVTGRNLKSGHTTSCGCFRKETIIARQTRHGHTRDRLQTTEYVRWKHMIGRCHNPNYPRFKEWGGRGIRVCDEWRKDFCAYVSYIRSVGFTGLYGQTLDRINNDGNYEPGNLRVTDAKGQNRNRNNKVLVTAFGKTHCIGEWAEITGISYDNIWYRLHHEWNPELALSARVRRKILSTT